MGPLQRSVTPPRTERPARAERIGCDLCDGVEAGWEIVTPPDLVRALEACGSAVERGTLREVATDSVVASPFTD